MATQAITDQPFTYRRSPSATEAFEAWLKEHGQELPKHTHPWDVSRSDIYVEDRWQPIFAEMRAKAPVKTLAQYDEMIKKEAKLPTVDQRPTASVVRTVD